MSSSSEEDETLQELFAAGKLQGGLYAPVKQCINNVTRLKEVTCNLENDLPWVESMAIVNEPAELAPELAIELKEQEQKHTTFDEFKRETCFYRQAQLAAIDGIRRLKQAGIPTSRPSDYFAEMMKSDEHMQKVRRSLLEKQVGLQRSQKVKEMRQHKKVAKQKQIESTLRKQKEKRDLNEEIKKYRRGMRTDLDFLDSSSKQRNKKLPKHKQKKKHQRPGKERRKNMKNKNKNH